MEFGRPLTCAAPKNVPLILFCFPKTTSSKKTCRVWLRDKEPMEFGRPWICAPKQHSRRRRRRRRRRRSSSSLDHDAIVIVVAIIVAIIIIIIIIIIITIIPAGLCQ